MGITIWAIESDYDKEAIKHLANKLLAYYGIKTTIRPVGRKAFRDIAKALKKKPDALEQAVSNYLKSGDDCVIFVLDSDSPIRLQEKKQNVKSALNQIEHVVDKFEGQVHIAPAIHELEAWLLVDCLGICCYFAGVENSQKSRKRQQKKFQSLLKKYHHGNTELIVEATTGGKGPKEYLTHFSEKILTTLNPKITPRVLNQKKYREALSPELAKYTTINEQTLRCNKSLQQFGQKLTGKKIYPN